MRFGSVCSGIEAASVAWSPLGWEASWFAEIEPFPSAVLAHHYPHVPNLGDMTTIARRVLSGEVEAPDLLCGGTPCQAFSVAGLRKSLDDDRGNLTLKFVELADAIDHVRVRAGLDPADIFWENVPGVLSTKDNAFGCFLAGLAGEDEPLVSPRPPDAQGRRTWSNAGCVYGPKRAIAWRTLDAQYFGLAQRRRRVFVVASARNGFDPATVLFEWDGVRRDTPPSRQAGQDTATGTLRSTDGGSDVDHARAGHLRAVSPNIDASFGRLQGCSGQDANHGHGHLVTAFGGNRTSSSIDISPALLAQPGSGYKGDFESETFLVQGQAAYTTKLHNTQSNQAGKIYEEYATSLDANSPPPAVFAPVCIHADAVGRSGDAVTPSPDAEGRVRLRNPGMGVIEDGTAYNLMASGQPHAVVAFDTTQVTSATNRSNPQPGDPCHPLAAGAHAPAIAFKTNQTGANGCNWSVDRTHSLSSQEQPPAIAFDCKASGMAGFGVGDIASTMRAMGHAGSHSNGGGQLAVAYPIQECNVSRANLKGTGTGLGQAGDPMFTLQAAQPHGVATAMQVRRLTPTECERLQGFPDGWTQIPWRNKPASECPDGPRYKALGNSWATHVVNWLGRRLAKAKGLEVSA